MAAGTNHFISISSYVMGTTAGFHTPVSLFICFTLFTAVVTAMKTMAITRSSTVCLTFLCTFCFL